MKNKPTRESIHLIRFGKVIGCFYQTGNSTAVVLYAKGGPSFGDDGHSPIWSVCKRFGVALLVPDYIGYCRSEGTFSFRNCVKTLTESEKFLKGKISALNLGKNNKFKVNFDKIILIGSSWGGAIVPFFEKYQKSSIEHIGMISPVTDWKTQGKVNKCEEDVVKTAQLISSGYKNIYRGFKNSDWPQIFAGQKSEYNPIDNTHLLNGKKVYILHGNKDKVVYWKKSQQYYQVLKKTNKNGEVHFRLLPNATHASSSRVAGTTFILKEFL